MARALLPKQKAFVEHYAACGNATEAARLAGYSGQYARQNAPKLLQNTTIKAALAALTEKTASDRIATLIERQEFWTGVMRGVDVYRKQEEQKEDGSIPAPIIEMKDRLKASELLGKVQQDFESAPITINNLWITPDTLRTIRETVYGLKTS